MLTLAMWKPYAGPGTPFYERMEFISKAKEEQSIDCAWMPLLTMGPGTPFYEHVEFWLKPKEGQ